MSSKVIKESTLTLLNETTDQEGEIIDISYIYGYSIQWDWTSTSCTAVLKMMQSNNGIKWSDVIGSDQAISDNSGDILIDLHAQMAGYVKAVVTISAGTLLTLESLFNAKG